MPECAVCNNTSSEAMTHIYGGSGRICPQCISRVQGGLLYCNGCGVGLMPTTAFYEAGWLCADCVEPDDDINCAHCGQTVPVAYASSFCTYTVVNYSRSGAHYHPVWHNHCLEYAHGVNTCPTCGMLTHELGGHHCMRCGGQPSPDTTIHDYSYMPPLRFLKGVNSCEELFLGVELEITPQIDGTFFNHQAALSLLPDFVYAKRDSSIPNGFEMVTHPFAQSCMRDKLRAWLSMFTKLYSFGYRSGDTNTCGTHIHMSQVAFTHAQLY